MVGIGVFAIWVGIDQYYPKAGELFVKMGLSSARPRWKTQTPILRRHAARMVFHAVHLLGMTFIVPPLEEVFYRSFLYRYLANQNFLSVPLDKFLPFPFFATAIVFGFSHNEWLAGIICGAAFQWLVIRKNRLGDAMTAHAIANFCSDAWIIWRGAWNFW